MSVTSSRHWINVAFRCSRTFAFVVGTYFIRYLLDYLAFSHRRLGQKKQTFPFKFSVERRKRMNFLSWKFEEICFIKFRFKNCDDTLCKTPVQETFPAAYWALREGAKLPYLNVMWEFFYRFFCVFVNLSVTFCDN